MLTGGRGDARNLIGVVVEVTDDRLYRIRTKEGRLNTLLARSMFSIAREKFLRVEDCPQVICTISDIN